MKDKEFREALFNFLEDQQPEADQTTFLLENPDFDRSVIGITQDFRLVYSLDLMIKELSEEDDFDEDSAADFVFSDTLWAISQLKDRAPIILLETRESLIGKYKKEGGEDDA